MAEKKLISKFEIVLTILAICIIVYVVMQKYDVSIAKKTEDVIFTDNPQSTKTYQKKQKSEDRQKRDRDVEEMLKQLDGRSASKKSNANRLSESSKNATKRSKDENRFLKKMTSKYAENTNEKNDLDVFALMKSSKDTYLKVRSLFSEELETPKSEAEVLIEDVSSLLKNKTVANSVYHEIEDLFGIPSEKSADFAKKGQQAVSDWATFVEENKEN